MTSTPDNLALFTEPPRSPEFPPRVVAATAPHAGLRVTTFYRDDELSTVAVLGWPDLDDALAAVRSCEPDTVDIAETYGSGVHLQQVLARVSRECDRHGAKYKPSGCEWCHELKNGAWSLEWSDVLPTTEGSFPVTLWEVPTL